MVKAQSGRLTGYFGNPCNRIRQDEIAPYNAYGAGPESFLSTNLLTSVKNNCKRLQNLQ